MHCWYLVLPWEILAHGSHFLKRRKNIYKKGVKKKIQPNYRDQDHYFLVLFVSQYVQTGLNQCPGHQPSVHHV